MGSEEGKKLISDVSASDYAYLAERPETEISPPPPQTAPGADLLVVQSPFYPPPVLPRLKQGAFGSPVPLPALNLPFLLRREAGNLVSPECVLLPSCHNIWLPDSHGRFRLQKKSSGSRLLMPEAAVTPNLCV